MATAQKRSRGVDANELGNDPIDQYVDDGNPEQPEDTRDVKAAADRATRDADRSAAEATQVEANAPEQVDQPVAGYPAPIEGDLPEGVSAEDAAWWNNPLNRNYMAGDGPHASITEIDGSAQSASSVDPEVRARTLEESRQNEENNNTNPNPVDG
jgi:hypothetical protein